MLECQCLEKRGPKIEGYVISTVVTVTLHHSYSFQVLSTDYIPDACAVASLHSMNLNSTTSVQVRL